MDSVYKVLKIHVGIIAATNKHGRVQSFPYDVLDPTGPPRSSKYHRKEAIEAVEKETTVIHDNLTT